MAHLWPLHSEDAPLLSISRSFRSWWDLKKPDLIKVWQYTKAVIAPVDHNIVDIDYTLSHFIPV